MIRFSSFGGLALRAENVSFDRKEDGENVANASAVGIVLDPLALLTGRAAPSRLDIDGAMFNPAMLPKGPPIDFSTLRLDAVPSYQETAFAALEGSGRWCPAPACRAFASRTCRCRSRGPRDDR